MEQHGPTSQLLLPVHLIEEVLRLEEEVVDLAALLVPLRGVVDAQLGLLGEELADAGHGEHDLLHGAVRPDNLHSGLISPSQLLNALSSCFSACFALPFKPALCRHFQRTAAPHRFHLIYLYI